MPVTEANGPAGSAENGAGTSSQELKGSPSSKAFEQSRVQNRTALKGFGALIALVTASVVLWHYWRPLLYLSVTLGVWYAFASFNLRAKRSKVHSIGGGFVLGLFALMLVVKLFGGPKEMKTEKEKQAFAPTVTKEGLAQNAQIGDGQSTFPMTAKEFLTAFNKVSSYHQIGSLANKTIDGRPWLVCALNDKSRLEIGLEPGTDRIHEVVCGFTKNPPGSSDAYFLASKVIQTLSPDVDWGEASHFVDRLASGADGSKRNGGQRGAF